MAPAAAPRWSVCTASTYNWPTAVITADEAYLRESILQPSAKVVAGFQPLMPTFQGLVKRGRLVQ